ncbi:Uncharacterised protein [BD1-7 clade bacterium]|nr:Uncharacterised protein [BD1-7 clade bacterium]
MLRYINITRISHYLNRIRLTCIRFIYDEATNIGKRLRRFDIRCQAAVFHIASTDNTPVTGLLICRYGGGIKARTVDIAHEVAYACERVNAGCR